MTTVNNAGNILESSSQSLDRFSQYAHWAPRLALASVFLFHGLTKFPALSGMSQMLGLPVAVIVLVALLETAGGALIIVGALTKDWVTRLAGLLLLPPMIGAIFTVHWPRWSFTPAEGFPMGGMEFQVTLILIAIFFILRGNNNTA